MSVTIFSARPAGTSASVSEPALTVRWLVRLRWGSVLAEAVTVAVAVVGLGIPLATVPLAAVIATIAASNVGLHAWQRAERPIASGAIGAVLLGDTCALTALLYLSGGPWNPFTSLYLVYVSLAALALGMRWASAIVVTAMVGYAWLFHAHLQVAILEHHHMGPGMPAHLQAMWVAFAVTGTVIAYYGSRVASALRERDAQLAQAQRAAARNEKLVSLSTLAAGAAHELGTPLATIAVAANELERGIAGAGPVGLEDARIIRDAVERCRRIVLQMSGRSADGVGEVPQRAALEAILTELRERSGVAPPERLKVAVDASVPKRVAVPREGLVQALACLVRNAIDATAPGTPVTLHVILAEGHLRFDVQDQGSGISDAILERLGEPFFTTKGANGGMGLGVFLARAFAERWRGRLAIDSVSGRGTRATLELPVLVEA